MRSAALGVALLLAVVSGCSARDAALAEVGPLASGGGSPSASPSSAPSAGLDPSPWSSSSPVAPSIPIAAEPATPQGARAFTEHYFTSAVNLAYATGDAAGVSALSDSACGSCANIVADVRRLADADHRVTGQRFKLEFAEAAPPDIDGDVIVDFRFSSDPYVEIDGSGATIRSEPPQVRQDAQVMLRRGETSWTVVAIRTV